jgi:hypothetical protein
MNRRWFLKGLAGAAAGVAISDELMEALKPKSSIFLPPKSGWWMPPLRMREIEQYDISSDAMPIRYDAAWILMNGTLDRGRVEFPTIRTFDLYNNPHIIEQQREIARACLTDLMIECGGVKQAELVLPHGVSRCAIV